MKLLFTSGIYGEITAKGINLTSVNKCIKTKYVYNAESIKKIEDEYKIKLIGEIYIQGQAIKEEDYNFVVYDNNYLRNISNEMYELDAQIVRLYDLIEDRILGNIDEDELSKINTLSPIFISTEGLEQNFFMSKEEFQRGLHESPLISLFSPETTRKLIYMYDLQSMIYDFRNSFYSIENAYIFPSNEFYNIISNALGIYNHSEEKNMFEYVYQGSLVGIVSAHFMSVIIRICSTLDILTKFIFEITNMPDEYNKFIKFKSGNIYFSNIGKFADVFQGLDNYKGSIIDKRESFGEIILVRNAVVHNSFLSIKPVMMVGCGTPEINNHSLVYGKIYIWDIDEECKAVRWLNRSRFYSQSRCIQAYLLSEILKFYNSFIKTIVLLKEYLLENI